MTLQEEKENINKILKLVLKRKESKSLGKRKEYRNKLIEANNRIVNYIRTNYHLRKKTVQVVYDQTLEKVREKIIKAFGKINCDCKPGHLTEEIQTEQVGEPKENLIDIAEEAESSEEEEEIQEADTTHMTSGEEAEEKSQINRIKNDIRMNLNEFNTFCAGQIEELAKDLHRAYISEGKTSEEANNEVIACTKQVCRANKRSSATKSVIQTTKYNTYQEVLSTISEEEGMAKQEAQVLAYERQDNRRSGFNKGGRFIYRGRGFNRGNGYRVAWPYIPLLGGLSSFANLAIPRPLKNRPFCQDFFFNIILFRFISFYFVLFRSIFRFISFHFVLFYSISFRIFHFILTTK